MTTFYVSAGTWATALLDHGSPASLHQASELLARLHRLVASQHSTRFAIEVLALQAWLEDALGNELAALAALQQAVTLARARRRRARLCRPGTARWPGCCTRLNQQGFAVDYVGRLLDAFSAHDVQGLGPAQPPSPPAKLPDMVEPLTVREIEVLELLAQRLSAKEIAQRLFISDRTVKRHAANIYQKLGVNGRQQAVAAAKALGLLISG